MWKCSYCGYGRNRASIGICKKCGKWYKWTKKWIMKKDDMLGDILQSESKTGGTVTIPLPMVFRATAKKRYGTLLQLFRKRKKYHSFELNFLDNELVAEALEGRKLKITIEIVEE